MGARVDPDKCRSGLHDWETNKIWIPSDEKWICSECKRISRVKFEAGESHRRNGNACARGHEYTLENTKKRVRFRKGKREIVRQCIQCEKDSRKTSVR